MVFTSSPPARVVIVLCFHRVARVASVYPYRIPAGFISVHAHARVGGGHHGEGGGRSNPNPRGRPLQPKTDGGRASSSLVRDRSAAKLRRSGSVASRHVRGSPRGAAGPPWTIPSPPTTGPCLQSTAQVGLSELLEERAGLCLSTAERSPKCRPKPLPLSIEIFAEAALSC